MSNMSWDRGGRRPVIFACPRFELDEATTPENLVQQMLASKAAWHATADFAKEVIEELRKEEKKRSEQRARSAGRQAMEQQAPYTDAEERRCRGRVCPEDDRTMPKEEDGRTRLKEAEGLMP